MGMVDEPGCFLMAVTARCAECAAESYATVVVKMVGMPGHSPARTGLIMKSMNMVEGWGVRDSKTDPVPVCPKHNAENRSDNTRSS